MSISPPVDWLGRLREGSDKLQSPTEQLRTIERLAANLPSEEIPLFITALALELIAARMSARMARVGVGVGSDAR